MYCPSCGNQQPEEKKFCPACGTNLGLISSALTSNNPTYNPALLSEARSRYNKQFSAAIGNTASGIGLLIAAIFINETMRLPFIPWVSMGLLIGGFSALGKGIGLFYFASNEWKLAQMNSLSAAPTTIPLPSAPQNTISAATSPLPPSSITDHTTRHLG